jgi:hypothetical protein
MEVTGITFIGYGQPSEVIIQYLPSAMVRPMEVIYFYFLLKQKLLPPQAQIHTLNIRITDIR